jgi:uncharacterized membrane protein
MSISPSVPKWLSAYKKHVTILFIGVFGLSAVELAHRFAQASCTAVGGQKVVSLPLFEFAPGQARTFCYRDSDGETIRFIVARDSDGTIHSAFDACHSCFQYGQGYSLRKGQMVCRFCGQHYPLKDIGTGIASCVPIQLRHLSLADKVQINVADLEAGRRLFHSEDR